MAEFERGPAVEGPPIEPIEKTLDMQNVALKALDEIRGAQQPGSEINPLPDVKNLDGSRLKSDSEYSTRAVSDLKFILRDATQESSNFSENQKKIMFALRETHLAMDDEKISVQDKINEIVDIMDRFVSNSNDFRVKYPDLTQKLINFCENLSQR